MAFVIKILERVGPVVRSDGWVEGADKYVRSYDPEAYDGMGDLVATTDKSLAMKFASSEEAVEMVMSSPKSRPFREDGKPNRPLTAFTLAIAPE